MVLARSSDYPFLWQRVKVCPIYPEFVVVRGDYGVRLNRDADEDDRGGHTAWEVWHWPSNTVESDWFTMGDAWRAMGDLHYSQQTRPEQPSEADRPRDRLGGSPPSEPDDR